MERSSSSKRDETSAKAQKRRNLVPVACETCRRKKIKCDGQRPCSGCQLHERACVYNADQGETHSQAVKRKYEEVERSRNALLDLLQSIVSKDENSAIAVLRRLRAEEDLSNVSFSLENNEDLLQPRDIKQRMQHQLLVSLAASTTGLLEIVNFIAKTTNVIDLGSPPELDLLLNRIVTPETLVDAVRGKSEPRRLGSTNSQHIINSGLDDPTFMVTAAPWTNVSDDDVFISRLISVFINYCNPYWRYIEEDLFLQDMRSTNGGTFCSSFLLHCEYAEAFVVPGNYISRGLQFHEEALRLWLDEMGRSTLTNIQGLTILSMEDNQTMSLIAEALRLSKHVLPSSELGLDGSLSPLDRAKTCSVWAIHHVDAACSTGLLRESQPVDPRLNMTPFLADSVYPLSGKPYSRTIVTFRRNALLRETCMLVRLRTDMNSLLYSERQLYRGWEFSKAVAELANKFRDWYDNLPSDLRYHKNIPAPLYELHADYYCATIALYSIFENSQDDQSPLHDNFIAVHKDSYDATIVAETLRKRSSAVMKAVSILRDYREIHGLKVSLPFIFQLEAYTSFNLLRHLRDLNNDSTVSSRRNDIEDAFEESFRCLLGTSTQLMMARGVGRMVVNTAESFRVRLPVNVNAVLPALETWQPTDLEQISSSYPNYAIANGPKSREGAQMEVLLRKWEDMKVGENPSGAIEANQSYDYM